MKNIKKYLPSKVFAKIISITILITLIFLSLFFLINKKQSFKTEEKTNNLNKKTVLDYINQDTDQDGVLDWEEDLWGTNKNLKKTFDVSDFVYIQNKKKELNLKEDADVANLNETEKFAREFFTAYTALKSSGEVNEQQINIFSHALGEKIITQELKDIFNQGNVKYTKDDNPNSKNKYYQEIKSHFEEYRSLGLGDELQIVSNIILESQSKQNYKAELGVISEAYKNFSNKVIQTQVPKSLEIIHLDIANNANNLGNIVYNMAQVSDDPIIGLSSLSQYQKYSDYFVSAVENLEDSL